MLHRNDRTSEITRTIGRVVTRPFSGRILVRRRRLALLPSLSKDFRWPKPWRPLGKAEASAEVIAPQPYAPDPASFTFEAELQHEVCPGHPLHRAECRAVARSREHPDEFIFMTANPHMPIAFVHLTWAVESDPSFPYTVGYPSWEAFCSAWSEADA